MWNEKKNKLFSFMLYLQTYYHYKLDFQKVDQHTADKWFIQAPNQYTVYPKKYAHGFVVLCFVVVMQSFIKNSHEVFIHTHQGCFAGTGAIVRLPQCQWSKPDGYGKISQCITTTKHSKAKTVCIFLGIYCICTISTNIPTPSDRYEHSRHQASLQTRVLQILEDLG